MKNVKLMTLKKPLMGGKPSYVSFGANFGRTALYESFSHIGTWKITNGAREE
ncbi:hypothetical protein PIB30_086004 [Stylosanthes scabra]|uniref:Uncharacterized protein n=1 Tax=Stylosanthes scabra TaxID=79078 RepID=A0ABU6TTI1_9FABA|nr:hypothetical protein [Stylosanthes scabra]